MYHKYLDVYLLRHTRPGLEPSICYGQLDCPLADGYQREIDKMAEYFKDLPISAIYSSPLQRCAILAQAVAEKQAVKVQVQFKEALKEIHFGDWEGVPWNEISRQKIEAWNAQRLYFQFPNGETPYLFAQRVVSVWQEIIDLHRQPGNARQIGSAENEASRVPEKEVIVIISHGGVIRSILCDFLSIPFTQSTKLQIDQASVSRLSFQGEASSCLFVNRKC